MKKLSVFVLFGALSFGFGQALKVEPAANPAGPGSIQPNWSAAPDGGLLMSWVEPSKGGSFSLRYAVRHGSIWQEPRTVAANRKFFHHAAEVPEVMMLNGGSWLAHWIETPKEGSDAEYIYVSSSKDGLHWTEPVMAHKNRAPVQHGLAAMVQTGENEVSLSWLQALQGEDGPTALMRTVLNTDGKEIREEQIDRDVCACCPTAVVQTSRGLLVAYRDHRENQIRDIATVRLENGHWTPSKIVTADNWQIDACPTNAAAAAARADRVALAWFTAASERPRVELAFSSDAGATFTKAIVVSEGHAFGYTALSLRQDGGALVSWIEEGKGTARVLARVVSPTGALGPIAQVATGGRQELGYPRLGRAGNETWIAWGDGSRVHVAALNE